MLSSKMQCTVATIIPRIDITASHHQQTSSLQVTLPDRVVERTETLGYWLIDLENMRKFESLLILQTSK